MIRFVLLVISVLGVAQIPSRVHAQLFSEAQGWGIKNKGPASANGLVYFIRGYSNDILPGWNLVPYFLRSLNADGWDVIINRINPKHTPNRALGWPESRRAEIAQAIREAEQKLRNFRRQGYKTIIGAGHSFGAWTLLEVGARNGALVDELILSAPSAHARSLTQKGQPNPLFYELSAASKDRFSKLRTPTFVALFKDDEYEAPRRAELVSSVVAKNKMIYLVDRPAGFAGHFSAWTPIFDLIYGDCIAKLVQRAVLEACTRSVDANADWRSILGYDQIPTVMRKPVDASTLLGKQFVRYGLGHQNTFVTLQSNETVNVMSPMTRQRVALKTAATGRDGTSTFCLGSDCGRLVKWNDDVLLEFDVKGDALRYWWLREPPT
jgi:hypothetical protein